MQVLDRDHERRPLGEAGEELPDHLERPPLQRLGGELRGAGRSVVLATHNVDEGVELASVVAFQRRGRFVQLAPRGGRSAAQIAEQYRRAMAEEGGGAGGGRGVDG